MQENDRTNMDRSFGSLREWRDSLGLTQAQLAEKLGFNRVNYARWEGGAKPDKTDRDKLEAEGYNGPYGKALKFGGEVSRDEFVSEIAVLKDRVSKTEKRLEQALELLRDLKRQAPEKSRPKAR